jgi:hypothetical protein
MYKELSIILSANGYNSYAHVDHIKHDNINVFIVICVLIYTHYVKQNSARMSSNGNSM